MAGWVKELKDQLFGRINRTDERVDRLEDEMASFKTMMLGHKASATPLPESVAPVAKPKPQPEPVEQRERREAGQDLSERNAQIYAEWKEATDPDWKDLAAKHRLSTKRIRQIVAEEQAKDAPEPVEEPEEVAPVSEQEASEDGDA